MKLRCGRGVWGVLLLLVSACAGAVGDEETRRVASNLTGSPFEAADGNLVVDGGAGAQDWANAPSFVSKSDLIKGQGDDTFAGGVKEGDVAKFTTDAIPPHKTDLTRFYVGSDTTGANAFLYLSWQRTADLGAVNLDFEFNQGTPAPGTLVPTRAAGDILVTYDFAGNGAVQLGLLTWLTAAPVNPAEGCFRHLDQLGNAVIGGTLPCWGKRVDLTTAGFAEGSVNAGTVADPQNGGAQLLPHLFGEAAINLTAAGVISPTSCRAFNTSTAHSRSSEAFDSSLQDFVGPLAVNINTCQPATIKLKKTRPDGTALAGAVLQLFHDADNDGVGDSQVGSNCTTGADGIGDCSFTVSTDGKYIGHELTPPAGYGAAPDPAPVTVTLTSSPQTITIVFTNSVVPGTIYVHKQDDLDLNVAGAVFTLYADLAPTGGTPGVAAGGEDLPPLQTCTTNANGDCSFPGVLPGLYWVVETSVPSGYKLGAKTFEQVNLPLGSAPNTGPTANLTFVNPRVFRIIVLVCREDGTLVPSEINVDGLGAQTSISLAQATSAGLTQGSLCGITQAAFGDRAAGNHSGTMSLP